MSTATRVKLTAPGDSLTITVASCAPGGGRYPDVEFVGTDGNIVNVPTASAERQLGRLNLTQQTVVGKTITISRAVNPADAAKAFWNIDLSGPKTNGAPKPTQSVAAPHDIPPMDDSRFPFDADEQPVEKPQESGAALYLSITKWTLEKVVPVYKQHGLAPDASAVAAMAATLFIQANKR